MVHNHLNYTFELTISILTGWKCHVMSRTLKITGNHVKFVHVVLLLVSEEPKT